MILVFSAAFLAAVGVLILLWRRRYAHSRLGLAALAQLAGVFLIATAVGMLALWGWAYTATDTSQFARALLWGDSDVGDVDRFPVRFVKAGGDVVRFDPALATRTIDGFESDVQDADAPDRTLRTLLEDSDTTSFIVIRDGELLYEEYLNGSSRETIHTSFSVAKSFMATLVGIAAAEGSISSLDDPITEYLPELALRDSRFSGITIRHLLTMSSGLAFEDGSSPWADPANTYYGTDLRDGALTKTSIERPPGTVFHYNDWNPTLLGLILERVTYTSVAEYLETRLWQPMGAEADASWSLDSEQSGFEKSFVGINARSMDYARFGWLYLNEGRSGADQVIPADFVDEATRADATNDPAAQYQYLWWIDAENDAFYANGDHCQNIYVDPTTRTVIVRTGSSCGDIDWTILFPELADWLPAHVE